MLKIIATIPLVLVLMACGTDECTLANRCHYEDGEPTCDTGYTRSAADDDDDFKCIKPEADLLIRNQYAESLFSLSYQADGAESVTVVFTDQRVGDVSARPFPSSFKADTGVALTIHFSSVSLGTRYNFAPITTEMEAGRTFRITYDYDLATASFGIGSSWID